MCKWFLGFMHDLSYYSMGKQIKRYESIGGNERNKVEMHTFRTTDFSGIETDEKRRMQYNRHRADITYIV